MKKVLMILAEGFEEIEAIGTADILRRAGLELTIAGLNGLNICGSHNISVTSDALLDNLNAATFDAIVLPGGMPGSNNLKNSEKVLAAVQTIYRQGGIVSAICAAPIVLAAAGILNDKRITSYPGFENNFTMAHHTGKMTEIDGNIITGRGPGATYEFAAVVAAALGNGEQVNKALTGMFIR